MTNVKAVMRPFRKFHAATNETVSIALSRGLCARRRGLDLDSMAVPRD